MALVNTSLRFSTTQQSLWRPGPAEDLRIDTGNLLVWDPGEFTTTFDTGTFLGFGASATFYASAKFGLVAFANLGTGGSFDASYDIDLTVDLPGAVLTRVSDPTSLITFTYNYADIEVSRATLDTIGFGNSTDPDINIGAGLDLITELSVGFRDITFFTPFKNIIFDEVSIISVDNEINLFSLTVDDAELEIPLTDDVSLFARLPTGANVEATSEDTIVGGSGFSDTKFIELEADLDSLLTSLLNKIPLPPVKAAAKFLEEFVFAEHSFDLSDYLTFLPAKKIEFNFTLLDISASAGLVITEDVSLDITAPDGVTPYLRVTLTSATSGDTATGLLGLFGESETVLELDAPAAGFGTDEITAEYQIVEARLTHAVGLGLSASITITVLEGNLSGAWVPSALQFSFGPLASIEIPEGGLNVKLGDIYTPDPFTIASDAFNTAIDTYEVYYASASPEGWNKNAPGAEQELFSFAQAFLANETALRSQYDDNGFVLETSGGDGTLNFAGQAGPTMFLWDGQTANDVTLNTGDGSIVTIDMSTFNGGGGNNLALGTTGFAQPNSFSFVSSSGNPTNARILALDAIAGTEGQDKFFLVGSKQLTVNTAANIIGGNNNDFLSNFGNAATFFDGGPGDDTFIADFSIHDNDTAINFDLAAINIGGNDRAEIFLANRTITLASIESIAIRTGDANDVIRTHDDFDRVLTGGGNDVVDLFGDFRQDVVDLGAGDDVLLANFKEVTSSQGPLQFADQLFGGSGYDSMYLTSGQEGLKIDIFVNDGIRGFAFGDPLGNDATHAELTELQDTYFSMFASLEERANTLTDPATNRFLNLVNGTSDFGELAVYETIEVINIEDGGFVADDLVMFFGGTRYEGGLGLDTFTANFARFESLNGLGDRGGVYMDIGRAVSFYGATQISGFERFHIVGTTASDVLRGGAADDFLSGDAGDDVIYGGNDEVADTLRGGAGNDVMRWAVDGLDDMDGGADHDALLIEADGTEESALRLAYFDASGNALDPLEWFVASDSTGLVLFGLEVAQQALETGRIGISWDGTENYAMARNFEVIDIIGSDTQDDLLQYFNGTRYEGGESANDKDVFVADWSAQSVGIQLDLHTAIGAASAEGIGLTNGVFLSGIERAVLKAGQANDLLIGGALDDHFEGNGGADIFMGHAGANTLLGGAGKDLFYHMAEGFDTVDGGAGDDNLIIGVDGIATAGATLDVRDINGDSLKPFGVHGANDTALSLMELAESYRADGVTYEYAFGSNRGISFTGIEIVDFAGSAILNDLVLFQDGEGYVGGTPSKGVDLDSFVGDFRSATDDLYFNGRSGTTSNDVGQGTSLSGFERFVVTLGSGDDQVVGGSFTDFVKGGDGNDIMDGGASSDRFEGGDGDDTYLYTRGQDTVKLGAGTHDTVNIGGITSGGFDNPISFKVASITGDIDFEAPSIGGQVYSNETGKLDVSAFDKTLLDMEDVDFAMAYLWTGDKTGTEGITTSGVEHFDIYGSTGNDVLVAGKGSSILVGDDGDDFLVAHNGEIDLLAGGAGNDTYVLLGQNEGRKIIADEFDIGSRVHFTNFNRAELRFFENGPDLVVAAESATGFMELLIRDYFTNGTPGGREFVFSTADDSGFTPIGLSGNAAARIAGRNDTGSTDADGFFDTTAFADTATGQEGDDQLSGSAGADIFIAGLGSDGVDYSRSASSIFVSLEQFETFGGDAQGDVLISIEQVHGSEFDDAIDGNHTDNTLIGGDGNDQIGGRSGRDTLLGGLGDDQLDGGEDNDLIQGEEGNDEIAGGQGSDHLIGGSGDDMIYGEDDADIMEGGLGEDYIEGGEGDDFHIFVGGYDFFDGGAGTDTTSFAEYENAVSVNLGLGVALTGFAESVDETDPALEEIASYVDVENVLGSSQNDVILGDSGTNVLDGGDGDDGIAGGAGIDVLIGGAGSDTLRYDLEGASGTQGVVVDLSGEVFFSGGGQQAIDSTGAKDLISEFENVTGTNEIDEIAGDLNDNILRGLGGNDTIGGLAGNDTIEGGEGNDEMFGHGLLADAEDDNDILRGGGGNDTLFGDGGNDILDGGDDDDSLFGGFGDDFLSGGSGIDTLEGGDGQDVADYRWTTQGITVTGTGLHAFTATGAEVSTDTGTEIELIIGGLGNDSFTGSAESDAFAHFGGIDSYGGGSSGLDRVTFRYFDAAVDVDLTRAGNQALSNGTGDLTTGGLTAIADFTGIEAIEGSKYGDRLTGFAPANGLVLLFGGAGNDLLTGVTGAFNLLDGGEGDDIFIGLDNFLGQAGSPIEQFDGGAGFDIISFDDSAVGVVFSLADGDGDDVIVNMEGLVGSAHGDILFGTALADVIDGGLGTDDVKAGAGEDTVIYRGGFDILDGGAGFDTLDLSALDVAVYVQDSIVATDGDDTAPDVNGGAPFTELLIYTDFENFIGTIFNDTIFGDARANRFADGLGDDTVFGLAGADLFAYAGGADIWDGGAGEDTVNYINFGAAVSIDLSTPTGFTETSDGDTVVFADARTIGTLTSIEHAVGTFFADIITGTSGNNILSGASGDDQIEGGLGDDDLFGGDGSDTVTFLSSAGGITFDMRTQTRQDTGGAGLDLIAGFENVTGSVFGDTLLGTDSDNIIDGFFGDDAIFARAGNDTIRLSEGFDTVDGGTGTDTADFSRNELAVAVDVNLAGGVGSFASGDNFAIGPLTLAASFTSVENVIGTSFVDRIIGDTGANMLEGRAGADIIDGGDGNDAASYAGSSGAVIINLTTGVHTGADAQGDTLTSIENVLGSAFGDRITGDAANNVLDGAAGDDVIAGEDGDDTLSGGAGNDTLQGGDGQDGLSGGEGDDTLTGGRGADLLLGDAGNDTLSGGADDDILQGGHGDDTISGGGENDALSGGNGNDTLAGESGNDILSGGAGNDTLDGGVGIDTADYSTASGRVVANLLRELTTGAAGRDMLIEIEHLIGSEVSDILNGDNGANDLFGLGGSDVLRGKDGADNIFGGAGNDRIFGDDGGDVIEGGAGDDIIRSGSGDDTVRGGRGNDVIRTGAGDDTAFGEEGEDRLFGNRDTDHLYGGDDDDRLDGGGGADFLFGGAGRDALRGGSGQDRLEGGEGDDNLFGGENRDTFVFLAGDLGADEIKDFEDGLDLIDLSDWGFANFAEAAGFASDIGTANMKFDFTSFGVDAILRVENFRVADLDTSDLILSA